MDYRTIVSAEQLQRSLANPGLVIFDCRHELMSPDAGARAYGQSHLPGARFAHSETDLAGPKTGRNGRHPLPHPQAFIGWLGRNGVDADKQVVAYDFAAGSSAARLWWMLRWVGHERVAVLDGGWEGWIKAGLPVTAEQPRITATSFVGEPRPMWVGVGFVHSRLGDPSLVVLDARTPERFQGLTEPIDPVAGHIPGARNRLFKDNLTADGRFRPPQELRQAFTDVLGTARPEQVVHQCGSGVSACSNLLAMEIAGLKGSRLYPGSWSEWVADPSRPVAKG
jgi:thiosulfate/3-mercaptopyruvate sulfurtransferase